MQHKLGVLVIVILLILCATSPWLSASGFSFIGYLSSAPASIPIPESGTINVAMARLAFRSGSNGDYSSFSSITLALTTSGAFSESDVQAIKIYFERNGDGLWSTSDSTIMAAGGPYTFSGGTATVPLDPTSHYFDWGGTDYLHVVLEFKSTSDTASRVGCEITSVTYGAQYVGTGSTYNPSAHNQKTYLDTWRANLTATGIAPTEGMQGGLRIPVLKLDLAAVDSSVTMDLDSITLHSIGTADTDLASGGVLLYEDANSNGSFEWALDTLVTSGTLSGGYVTLNPTSNLQFTSSGKTYFVAVNVALAAGIGNTVGLEIANPSTDLVFLDTKTDSYVAAQYIQKGYLLSTSATPTTGNSFTITEYVEPDLTPPTVSLATPTGSSVLIGTNIEVAFSEAMATSTFTASNFELHVGSASGPLVPGTVSTVNPTTMRLDPTSDLAYGTSYTAIVKTGVTDLAGNPLASEYSWSFITEPDPSDFTPPVVTVVSPANLATGVAIDAEIVVGFSETIDPTTLIAANFTLVDQNLNSQAITIINTSGTSVTFKSTVPLSYLTRYTVTVTTGIKDMAGNALAAAYSWSFTTFGFTKATIVNNRLGAGGGASEALIFVPQAGASDKVSVQVFTTKGRLVRTFYKNTAFSNVAVPIRWNGTNDMGKPLGPGLYFVQIVVGGTKQVLKVLIVR